MASHSKQIIDTWPEESKEAAQLVIDAHGEQANFLALNLMHDIVTGQKTVAEARQYHTEEFLNARRKRPTPYMEKLRFKPGKDTADRDQRSVSDQELDRAAEEGKQAG